MPKYILNPDGNVIDLDAVAAYNAQNTDSTTDPNVLAAARQEAEADDVFEATKEANKYSNDKSFSFKEGFDLSLGALSLIPGTDNIFGADFGTENDVATVSVSNDNKSFGFKNSDENYNIYKREGLDIFSVAEDEELDPYYHEFEYQTGWRLPVGDNYGSNLFKPVLALIEVLIDNLINVALCEAIISLNATIKGGNNKKLILGTRSFTEYYVLSRYVFDVLNYPKSNYNDNYVTRLVNRLTSFMFGFTTWLLPDVIFDYSKYIGQDNKNATLYSTSVWATLIDLAIDSFTNSHSLKRINLLRKKFYTQDYWTDEVLYKYKKRDYLDYIADFTNYYRFKFAIERIHVGEKMSKYFYDKFDAKNKNPSKQNNRIFITSESLNSSIKSKFARIYAQYRIALSENKNEKANKLKQDLENLYNNSRIVTSPVKYDKIRKEINKLDKLTLNESLSIRRLPQIYQFNEVFTQLGKEKPNDDFVHPHKSDRIPIDLVNKVEEYLDAEYMPFYLHDTRNNELISFNAFIENITDSFSPEYTTTSGFGRIDDVRAYVKTTRTINVSFSIVSTVKDKDKDAHSDDHSAMWFQINKLLSMIYPQWSKGEEFDFNGSKLEVPFSQVPTHSPLVRLRIGDVIKNNYSRFNLSRLFGIEGLKFEKPKPKTQDTQESQASQNEDLKINDSLPKSITDSDRQYETYTTFLLDTKDHIKINQLDIEAFKYLYSIDYTLRKLKSVGGKLFSKTIEIHNGNIVKYDTEKSSMDKAAIMFYYEKMLEYMKNQSIKEKIDSRILKYYGIEEEITTEGDINTREDFMNPGSIRINNPITKAYESNMSKGLAGFITSLDVNYNESTWEIDHGSRAPMMVKITFGFAPIHDIPPGLDHHGMMRAPIYNVGDINNKYFGTSDKK